MLRRLKLLFILPLLSWILVPTFSLPIFAFTLTEPAQAETAKPASPMNLADHAAIAMANPITTPGKWPRKAHRLAQAKRNPYNCVSTLKKAGKLPQGRVTRDGYARSIPVKTLEMKEGQTAVIVTRESWTGHALEVKLNKGKYISITEGNHPQGIGRVVDPAVIKGEVSLTR